MCDKGIRIILKLSSKLHSVWQAISCNLTLEYPTYCDLEPLVIVQSDTTRLERPPKHSNEYRTTDELAQGMKYIEHDYIYTAMNTDG